MLTLVGGPTTMVPVADRSRSASIFLGDHADLSLSYCSSAGALLKEVPDLVHLRLPEALEVHPAYGMAILSEDPAAQRFALFVFSRDGQKVLQRFGFDPWSPRPEIAGAGPEAVSPCLAEVGATCVPQSRDVAPAERIGGR